MDRTNKAMIVISSLEFDSYVITKIKKKSIQSRTLDVPGTRTMSDSLGCQIHVIWLGVKITTSPK